MQTLYITGYERTTHKIAQNVKFYVTGKAENSRKRKYQVSYHDFCMLVDYSIIRPAYSIKADINESQLSNIEIIKKWNITAEDFEDEEHELCELFVGTQTEAKLEAERLSNQFEDEQHMFLSKVTYSVK
jgi:hypothetical protein